MDPDGACAPPLPPGDRVRARARTAGHGRSRPRDPLVHGWRGCTGSRGRRHCSRTTGVIALASALRRYHDLGSRSVPTTGPRGWGSLPSHLAPTGSPSSATRCRARHPREVVEAVTTFHELDRERTVAWGAEGREPWARFLRTGELSTIAETRGGSQSTAQPCSEPSRLRPPIDGARSLDSGRGDVAQLVEHLLCKQGVGGSSPLVSTGRCRRWLRSH